MPTAANAAAHKMIAAPQASSVMIRGLSHNGTGRSETTGSGSGGTSSDKLPMAHFVVASSEFRAVMMSPEQSVNCTIGRVVDC